MKNFGILVGTYPGQRLWLKACLESCNRMNPKVIVVVYQGSIAATPETRDVDLSLFFPCSDVLSLADKWYFDRAPGGTKSWTVNQKYGLSILINSEIDFLLYTEGDCIFTKPSGINEIYSLLIKDDSDIISAKYERNYIGTVSYFAKSKVAWKINEYMMKDLKKSMGKVERAVAGGVQYYNFKCVPTENPIERGFIWGEASGGTWCNILGFRHPHYEIQTIRKYQLDPMPKEFYDLRFSNNANINEALEVYWKSGKIDRLVESGVWAKDPLELPDIIKKRIAEKEDKLK